MEKGYKTVLKKFKTDYNARKELFMEELRVALNVTTNNSVMNALSGKVKISEKERKEVADILNRYLNN